MVEDNAEGLLAVEHECQRLRDLIAAHTSANPILDMTTNYEALADYSLLELQKVAYSYKLITEDPWA